MSGAASLAAAKRRRNPPEMNEQVTPKLSGLAPDGTRTNRPTNPEVHPAQILRQHDRQIFILERKIESLEEGGGSGGGNGSSYNPELENLVVNSNAEIKILKNTISKQQKSIQELTSLVTSLRATVSSQTSDISVLTEQLQSKLTTSTEPDKNTIKLDISDSK
tara:strand:- start:721 stop:1209 length:489 start_codon:yes stop_codon:yes gene_type:complete